MGYHMGKSILTLAFPTSYSETSSPIFLASDGFYSSGKVSP